MSKINQHNYEAYFLDYSEGNLSEIEKQELLSFLETHPELKAELNSFEIIELPSEESVDQVLKAKIKKEELTELSRLDYLLIASAEEQLTEAEEEEFAELIKADSTLLDELRLYQKAKLPKDQLVFEDKEALKQKGGVLVYWRPYAAVVASTAAVIWLFFNINFAEPKYQSKQLDLQTAFDEQIEEPLDFNYVLRSEVEKEVAETKKNVRSKTAEGLSENQLADLADQSKAKSEAEKESTEVKNKTEGKQELQDMEPMPMEVLAEKEVSLENELEEMKLAQLAELNPESETTQPKPSPKRNEELSIQEFAKQKLQKEVLKNKTFSEALAEELASITNDKISFETKKDKGGETEKFALNIGKFSISKK